MNFNDLQRIADVVEAASEAFDYEEPKLLEAIYEAFLEGDDVDDEDEVAVWLIKAWTDNAGKVSDHNLRFTRAIEETRTLIQRLEAVLEALQEKA